MEEGEEKGEVDEEGAGRVWTGGELRRSLFRVIWASAVSNCKRKKGQCLRKGVFLLKKERREPHLPVLQNSQRQKLKQPQDQEKILHKGSLSKMKRKKKNEYLV